MPIFASQAMNSFFHLRSVALPMSTAIAEPNRSRMLGSGLNHVNPAAAEKVLEACCKFQKPNAIHYQ
ncbi:hypothetical protein HZ993_12690 [Rhodoferax sp. AJA081-3]|uniref:hypothetical protein n=1 Tax=Rhodoferax sp. AJA081-3 TaxID=2752316 RepID=UPI001AE0BD2B|nr:hypothetical protein [Rhodoferax sp. AJA081-3]QTN26203.1 hypothetical protein HZ993_12690 [Rhodoferax sp. AJA081-3]